LVKLNAITSSVEGQPNDWTHMATFTTSMKIAIATMGVAGGLAFAGPGVAAAAPDAHRAVPATAAAAELLGHSCAKVEHWTGTITQSVRVTNNCSYTFSYRVRRTGPDSPCIILDPGESATYQWGRGLDFQGIAWDCA
jgi:hypothetical protein